MKKIWTWLKEDGNVLTAFTLLFCLVLIVIATIIKYTSKTSPVEGIDDYKYDSIKNSAEDIKVIINELDNINNEAINEVDSLSDTDAIELFEMLLRTQSFYGGDRFYQNFH